MVKELIVKKEMSDQEVADLQGHWIGEKYIKHLVKSDCDIYYKDIINGKSKKILIAKFRKKAIPETLINLGFEYYKDAALASRGRGAAAGPIDKDNQYWRKRIPIKTQGWRTSYIVKGKASKMQVNNQVASNVLGYYEKTPFMKLPCRQTHYTRSHFEKFQKGFPYIQKMATLFKKLVPSVYKVQMNRANKRPHFRIPKTPFSSITVNRNFRTALHVDNGNFKQGFAGMTVMERGKYKGGYTVFPQFGVGVDIRHGDIIIMNNCQAWHANTEITESKSDKKFNENMENIFKDNPEVGTAGLDKKYTRISVVCYLREKILLCDKGIKGNQYVMKYNHSNNKSIKKKGKKKKNKSSKKKK
jgi:hypothetical protein